MMQVLDYDATFHFDRAKQRYFNLQVTAKLACACETKRTEVGRVSNFPSANIDSALDSAIAQISMPKACQGCGKLVGLQQDGKVKLTQDVHLLVSTARC